MTALLLGMWTLMAALATAAAPSLVAAGPDTTYLAQPDARSLIQVGRNGKIVASLHLNDVPTALALDPQRNLLYVALRNTTQILVLSGKTLRQVQALNAVAAAGNLTAVPGRNALYLFDPATQRTLYLTFTPAGQVYLVPVFAAITPPSLSALHVVLGPKDARGRIGGTFWANGFRPGEPVSVSWGASNRGTLRADRYGIVSGSIPVVKAGGAGSHIIGLYGISSHHMYTQVVSTGAHHRHAAPPRRARPLPPLYLSMLPGPVTTLSPPTPLTPVRVPVSASAAGAIPLVALGFWARRRKQRRKRATRKRPRRK